MCFVFLIHCDVVHWVWTEWSDWTDCTKVCEGGTQNRIRQCNNLTPHIDLHGYGCDGNPLEEFSCNPDYCKDRNNVRLVDGSNPLEGRLEVLIEGQWGTVCDDNWDMDDARVACRSLGYFGASSAPSNAAFGQGVGQIWMDNVGCNGSEHSLFSCPQSAYGYHNCQHSEDAGAVCY